MPGIYETCSTAGEGLSQMKRLLRRIYGKFRGLARRLTPLRFANHPKEYKVFRPFWIRHEDRIELGENAYIGPNSTIAPMPSVTTIDGVQEYDPHIKIGRNFYCNGWLHLYAASEVVIGDDVMLGPFVFIADCKHAFSRKNVAAIHQGFDKIRPVRIGDGTWICQGAVILPGVEIGKYCVIGANTVVSQDVPDGHVLMGSRECILRPIKQERLPVEADKAAAYVS